MIGSAVGPAPYPGDRGRTAVGHRARDARARCWGGTVGCRRRRSPASAAAQTRSGCSAGSSAIRRCGSSASRRRARGCESGHHGASLGYGEPGVLHGSLSYCSKTTRARSPRRIRSRRALDYPGRRAGAQLPARYRAGALRVGHGSRGAGRVLDAQPDRRHHSRTRERTCVGDSWPGRARRSARRAGRGLPVGSWRQGRRTGRCSAGDRCLTAPRACGRHFPKDRAALIPYVMGGYSSVAQSLDYARALAAHADILELGIPFSDPLADGPTIQAAGQRALEAGTRPATCSRWPRRCAAVHRSC